MSVKAVNPFHRSDTRPRVLITGATGGLGRALCRAVLTTLRPAALVAVARSPEKLAELAVSLGQPDALRPMPVAGSSEMDIATVAGHIQEEQGGLDLWLHSVGSLHGPGLVVEKSLRDINAEALGLAFQVNAVNFLLFAKHLKPLFRHPGGTVIAALSAKVGSIGDNQLGGWYSYRMSKAALNMSVRNVALELNRSGCPALCVAIHPGTTATPLSGPFTAGYSASRLYTPDQSAERILAVVKSLRPEQAGGFFNWDGTPLPW